MKIVNNAGDSNGFFSVNIPLAINGKLYRPSICYELTPELTRAAESLAKEKRINLYQEKVRFVSGAVAGVVREPAVAEAPTVKAGPTPAEKIVAAKDKVEHEKKEFAESDGENVSQETIKVVGNTKDK